MTTVYVDPAQMDATATAISDHAREVEAAVAGLESIGATDVPPTLAGWLAQELGDIATIARVSALLYVVAALDALQRAQGLQADQSLAQAAPDLGSAAGPAGSTGFVLGASAAPPMAATPITAGGFQLDAGATLDPTARGYVFYDGPLHVSPPLGSFSSAPRPGRDLVTENVMTRRLSNLDLASWTSLNRSMSSY